VLLLLFVLLPRREAVRSRTCARRSGPVQALGRAAPRRAEHVAVAALVAPVVRRRVSATVSRI
jgi:hypothetical protein